MKLGIDTISERTISNIIRKYSPFQCNNESDCKVDCSTGCRGMSMEYSTGVFVKGSRQHIRPTLSESSEKHGTKEVKITPRSPWQSPYIEKLIGSIRSECLDHITVLNAAAS